MQLYVFRDALLHTTVVMCGPSSLTSLKAFLPIELLLTG